MAEVQGEAASGAFKVNSLSGLKRPMLAREDLSGIGPVRFGIWGFLSRH